MQRRDDRWVNADIRLCVLTPSARNLRTEAKPRHEPKLPTRRVPKNAGSVTFASFAGSPGYWRNLDIPPCLSTSSSEVRDMQVNEQS